MSDGISIESVLDPILDQLLREHPLPWAVERDWTYEVIASDQAIIAKCMDSTSAQAIVHYAEQRRLQLDKSAEEVERFFCDSENAGET